MTNYKLLGVPFDRTFRNDLNANFMTIDAVAAAADLKATKATEDSAKAVADSSEAKSLASQANTTSDSVQTQINNIVIESGTSDAEVLQARGEYSVLNERLSATDAQMADVEQKIIGVNIRDFPLIVPEVDDTNRFNRAIASTTSNIQLNLEYAKTYYLNGVTVEGKTVRINLNQSKLLQSGNSSIFYFTGGYEHTVNVSSVTKVSYQFQGDTPYPTSKLTLSSTANYNVGDVVKVVSDDILPGSRPGNGTIERRTGEYAVIGGKTSAEIYLTSPLRESYNTNVRLTKLKDVTFSIEGGNISSRENEVYNSALITLKAARDVEVKNITSDYGYAQFITMVGLYGYTIDNVKVNNLKNSPSQGLYGYGINDISCEFGLVTKCRFVNARSGYTTNSSAVATGSTEFDKYGRSANTLVSHSRAHGISGTGFSTHSEAYNIKFDNCLTIGAYRGEDSTALGFGARGKKITFNNCVADGCRYSFRLYEEFPGATDEIYLDDCKSFRAGNYSVLIDTIESGVSPKRVQISGGVFESIDGAAIFKINKATKLTIVNMPKIIQKQTSSFARIFDISESDVEINGANIDAENYGSSSLRLFYLASGSTLKAKNINARLGSISSTMIIEGDGNANNKATILNFDSDKKANLSSGINNFRFSDASGFNFDQAYIVQTLTADEQSPTISNSAEQTIYLSAQANTTGWGFGVFPEGFKRGQMLVIRNTHSSNTLVIRSSSSRKTELKGGNPVILNPKESLTLVWNGSLWINTN